MRTGVSIPLAINDLSNLESLSARDRATRVYGLLRMILSVPVESRTAILSEMTLMIERHPYRESIRLTLRDFWSHHSYVRVISEAGLPDQAFLVRELVTRAVRHLLRVDEVEATFMY
jgi:hypothetical protein